MTFSPTAQAGTPQNKCYFSVSCRHNLQYIEPPPAEHKQNRPRTMSTTDGQPERVAGTVRTSAEAPAERGRRRGSPKPSPDWKSRNRAEDPKDRPRRADPRRNADRMQKPAGAIAPGAATRRAAPCIVASPNKYPQSEQTPHRTPYTEPERIAPTCHTGQNPAERPQNTLEATQSRFYQFCEHLPMSI